MKTQKKLFRTTFRTPCTLLIFPYSANRTDKEEPRIFWKDSGRKRETQVTVPCWGTCSTDAGKEAVAAPEAEATSEAEVEGELGGARPAAGAGAGPKAVEAEVATRRTSSTASYAPSRPSSTRTWETGNGRTRPKTTGRELQETSRGRGPSTKPTQPNLVHPATSPSPAAVAIPLWPHRVSCHPGESAGAVSWSLWVLPQLVSCPLQRTGPAAAERRPVAPGGNSWPRGNGSWRSEPAGHLRGRGSCHLWPLPPSAAGESQLPCSDWLGEHGKQLLAWTWRRRWGWKSGTSRPYQGPQWKQRLKEWT